MRIVRDIEKPLQEFAGNKDSLQAQKGKMLLDLVRYLEGQGPTPEVCGFFIRNELRLSPAEDVRSVSVRIGLDWPDYGPSQEGLPVMHYRISIRRQGDPLTQDARAQDPEQVERIIREAFGWGK